MRNIDGTEIMNHKIIKVGAEKIVFFYLKEGGGALVGRLPVQLDSRLVSLNRLYYILLFARGFVIHKSVNLASPLGPNCSI